MNKILVRYIIIIIKLIHVEHIHSSLFFFFFLFIKVLKWFFSIKNFINIKIKSYFY